MDNLTEIFKIISENLPAYAPELKPKKTSSGYKLTCPECQKPEAYYYKNNPKIIKCNRKNQCGTQTSLYDYLQKRENWNDDQVLKGLAKMTGYNLQPIKISAEEKQERAEHSKNEILFKVFKKWFENDLYNQDLISYLKNRGFSQDDLKADIGLYSLKAFEADFNNLSEIEIELLKEFTKYKNNYQLVIPWKNAKGKIEVFQLRSISSDKDIKAKYLFSGPLNNMLYNAQNAIKSNSDTVYIVEGVIDSIRLNSHNLNNVLATGGPLAFNENKIQFLKDHFKYIVLIPDNDEAGMKALNKTISILLQANINCYVKLVPESINNKAIKDADDYLNAGMTIDDLNKIKAISGIKYVMSNMDLNTDDPVLKDKNFNSLKHIIYNDNLDITARTEAINFLKKNGYTEQEIDLKRAEGRENNKQPERKTALEKFFNHKSKNLNRTDKLLGFKLKRFKKILARTQGIQKGLYITAAGANEGKTALNINIAIDLIQSNPNAKILFYSFDDDYDIILNRFIAQLAKTHINNVKAAGAMKPDIKTDILTAYDTVEEWCKNDQFDIKDRTEIRTINEFEKDILQSIQTNQNTIVFIDALHNLETAGGGSIRELNIDRAKKIKEIAMNFSLPIFATAEIRKQNNKPNTNILPTLSLDDINESGKYGYEASFVISIVTKAKKNIHDDDEKPILHLQVLKNKLNHDKRDLDIEFDSSTGIMTEIITAQERQNETRDLKDKCKNIVKTSIFNIK